MLYSFVDGTSWYSTSWPNATTIFWSVHTMISHLYEQVLKGWAVKLQLFVDPVSFLQQAVDGWYSLK